MTTASHQDLFKSSIASLRVAGANKAPTVLPSNEIAPISPPSSIKKADSVASSNEEVGTTNGEVSGGKECYEGNYKVSATVVRLPIVLFSRTRLTQPRCPFGSSRPLRNTSLLAR